MKSSHEIGGDGLDGSETYDDLIVGSGSAGGVIASRLSEDPERRVLLLEAGPDHGSLEATPPALRNANQPAVVPGLNWKINAFVKESGALSVRRSDGPVYARSGGGASAGLLERPPVPSASASTFDYEAGKVLGGSSAINAVQALRGTPEDFDDWAKELGGNWSWSEVLPFYRALEDDPVGDEMLHGRGGPLSIRRESVEELRPLQAKLREACVAHGFPETADHNNPATTGVGIIPKNVVAGVRLSTALTYLKTARSRANLKIVSNALVHRLVWKNRTECAGAEIEVDGRIHRIFAHRVVMCAGALNTPGILIRSGLGNSAILRSLDIEVRVPLTGVGENLMDHPVVGIWAVPKPGASTLGEPMRQTLLRYTSSGSRYRNDMHICMMAGIDVRMMPPRMRAASSSPVMVGVSASLMKSQSRGAVRIVSADPHTPPRVAINCLGEKKDILPLKEGIRLVWDFIQQRGLHFHFEQILAWTDGMVKSDIALEQAISAFVRPSAHAVGTARMGLSPDAGAVVDPHGRVYGTENLWVADASIMPTIPSAPTNLTCFMIGEKIAASLKRAR